MATYCPLYHSENFGHVLLPDGRRVTVFTNIDRLESHLIDLFPSDERPIRELATALRSVLDLDIAFSDARGWAALRGRTATALASVKHLPVLLKYGRMTVREFAAKFQDPGLVTAFSNFVHFGGRDVPVLTVLLPLAYAHRGQAGIPLRGWLAFARSIERRFAELGGEIRYGARVERLVVEGRIAMGVSLADGSRVAAGPGPVGRRRPLHALALPRAGRRGPGEGLRSAAGVFADLDEVVDVATPLTRERYTGNWMGAMQARKPSANMIRALAQGGPAYASPEIDGLYMAGQWVEAWGGITTAVLSGRKAVKAMCRRDGANWSGSDWDAKRGDYAGLAYSREDGGVYAVAVLTR